MAFGTPYLIGTTGAGSSSATQTITVATANSPGDVILVAGGNSSSGGATITGVVDSAGNQYFAPQAASSSNEFGQFWVASNGSGGPGTPTGVLNTSNTITVSYSTTSGEKVCMAVGCSGGSNNGIGGVDFVAVKAGTSAAPSVVTGYLGNAAEMAIGVIFNAVAGGVPSGTGSFNSIDSYQNSTSPEVSCYYQQLSAQTPVTLSGTITSSTWCAIVLTLLPASSAAVPYLVGTGTSVVSANTVAITTARPTAAGDSIVIAAANSGAATVTGVSDTVNTYVEMQSTTTELDSSVWVANTANNPGGPVALATGSTITVTYSVSNTNAKTAVVAAVTGYNPVDVTPTPTFSAGSTSPSIASGTLSVANEVIFTAFFSGSGGGAPTSPTNCLTIASAESTSDEFVTLAYEVVNSTSSVTSGVTISSTKWVTLLISLEGPAAPPVTNYAPPRLPLNAPGFTSPAAFSFAPQQQLISGPADYNDPAYLNPPYVLANSGMAGGVGTHTIPITGTSNTGDTIVVFAAGYSTSNALTSISDSNNNMYVAVSSQATTSVRAKVFVAVNPAPLNQTDTVTVTWSAGVIANIFVLGLPAVNPSGNGPGGVLIPDIAANSSFTGTILDGFVTAAQLSTVPQIILCYQGAYPTTSTGLLTMATPSLSIVATASGTVAGGTQASAILGYQVAQTRKANSGVIYAYNTLMPGAPTASCVFVVTFMVETRYAVSPGMPALPGGAPLAAPGYLSPAAWDFTPAAPQAVNDAPLTSPQPYFIGYGHASGTGTSITISCQNSTNSGDAIIVGGTTSNAGGAPVSCSDTQGNTYSLLAQELATKVAGEWVAQNTASLTGANQGGTDQITPVFVSANTQRQAIAIGIPAAMLVQGGSFLTFDMASQAGSGGSALNLQSVPASRRITYPTVVMAFSVNGNAAGPAAYSQGFDVLGAFNVAGSDWVSMAWKQFSVIPSGQVIVNTLQGSANISLLYISLIPETRFAPGKPWPDTPPGLQSPGAAWQFTPVLAGGNTAGVLPALGAAAGTVSELTSQAGKELPAAAGTAATVTNVPARVFTAAAVTTARVARQAGKILTGTAAAAAAVTRQAGKLIRASTATTGTVSRHLARLIATAVMSTVFVIRAFPVMLAATVTTAVGVVTKSVIKIAITAGRPVARWVAGSPIGRWISRGGPGGRWRT